MRKKLYHRNKKITVAVFVVAVSLIIALICTVENRITPVIKDVAAAQAENMANNAIEDAIVQVLSENEITYSSLVDIEKDNRGAVSTVKADTVSMNMLKNKISLAVSEKIQEIDSKKISIPLGTVVGISVFSGKGPLVTTEVTLASNVNLTIGNQFVSAGINQTLHEIIVNIDAVIFVIMPHSSTSAEVHTNFCIAQTVIIGTVPETFADFGKTGDLS